jgi:hypothetical protein
MNSLVVLAAFAGLALAQLPPPGDPGERSAPEQMAFSAEDGRVERQSPLPPAVAGILAGDPDVREAMAYEHISGGQPPASWFLPSEVHLNGPHEADLIVVGAGPILGANVTLFWVFRPSRSGGFNLLLRVSAHDLNIMESRTGGYRDIEVVAATAVSVTKGTYTFRGSAYKLSRSLHRLDDHR